MMLSLSSRTDCTVSASPLALHGLGTRHCTSGCVSVGITAWGLAVKAIEVATVGHCLTSVPGSWLNWEQLDVAMQLMLMRVVAMFHGYYVFDASHLATMTSVSTSSSTSINIQRALRRIHLLRALRSNNIVDSFCPDRFCQIILRLALALEITYPTNYFNLPLLLPLHLSGCELLRWFVAQLGAVDVNASWYHGSWLNWEQSMLMLAVAMVRGSIGSSWSGCVLLRWFVAQLGAVDVNASCCDGSWRI